MATTKRESIRKEAFSTEEQEILSRCTTFPLAQKKKARKNTRPKIAEPPYWVDEFIKMGADEADMRLEAFKAEIAFLLDSSMKGDQNAIQLLYRFSEIATRGLEQLINHNPELLHPISKYTLQWPSFIGNKKTFKAKNARLLKSIRLGEESPLNHHWNPESPASFTAYSMLHWLVQNQELLGLPTLNKETLKVWFDWGWRGFSHQLNGSPEKYPHMRELVGKHAEKESVRKQEKRKPESVIRTKMKDAVRQSFLQLLKNIP
jgi:hypothetical protein